MSPERARSAWTAVGALGMLLLAIGALVAFGLGAGMLVGGVCMIAAAIDGRTG